MSDPARRRTRHTGVVAVTVPELLTCGERLVELLEAYGIDTVFGIPGNHTVQLYRGLASSSLRHISPRHEQGAAFMADGYARASGKPAACFLISGPGLGNAVTPMMQALADSVPMLVVTAVAARSQLAMGEGRLHEVPDQRALASQCTRFSHTLMDPAELPKVLARAFAVFDSQRPGPVHIEVPLDVITMEAPPLAPWPRTLAPTAARGGLEQLAQRLAVAERPCLIAGGGAVGAADALRLIAEACQAPVVTTVNGKGILSPDHPLQVGGSPSLGCVRGFLAQADVVLAVGTEFAETDYDMLFLGDVARFSWLARIDIDAAQLCRNMPADLALCGDARSSLEALVDLLGAPKTGDEGAQRVARLRADMHAEEHVREEFSTLFATLRDTLPDLCLVGDSTLPTYHAVWQYEAPGPRRYFHSATGAGTLGYALPAAIGARRALPPEVPVVALIGDGALQFTLTELASAAQERLSVIVLVWNNNGYAEIRNGMEASDIEPIGVDVTAPDFVAAAQALGCAAWRVPGPDALAQALRDAQEEARPTLLELPEDAFLERPSGLWY